MALEGEGISSCVYLHDVMSRIEANYMSNGCPKAGGWSIHNHYQYGSLLQVDKLGTDQCKCTVRALYNLLSCADGFRKVTNPEKASLAKAQSNEPVEFWHTNFRRGHPELISLVQRRVRLRGVCLCVCVCLCVRDREGEKKKEGEGREKEERKVRKGGY